jgi:hypothetical protein
MKENDQGRKIGCMHDCMGEVRNIYKILIGKPDGKKPFQRSVLRWENNVTL